MFNLCQYISIKFQHSKESFLRHFNISYLLHTLLSFLLFLKEFAFTAHITSITFCRNILSDTLDCISCHDLCADCSLYGYIKLLAWYQVFQLFTHLTSYGHGIVLMRQCGQSINWFAIEQYVKLGKTRWPESINVIVKLGITLAD